MRRKLIALIAGLLLVLSCSAAATAATVHHHHKKHHHHHVHHTPPPTPSPTPTTPAPSPSSSSPPPPTATGGGHKVLVIMEENHGRSAVVSGMPYLMSLAHQYGQATNYFALHHPSLPNYLAIFGGSSFGTTSDCSIGSSGCVPTAPSVYSQTIAAGKTAKVYSESMTSNCQTSGGSGYVARHVPWPYWTDTNERNLCKQFDVPAGTFTNGNLLNDVKSGNLPVTGELVPNLNNDAHDGSLAQADAWLKNWIPVLMNGPDYKAGNLTIIITFDEDSGGSNNVAFVVVDPRLHGKVAPFTTSYNHFSLTRWLDENAGVPLLRNAAGAPDLKTAFGL